MTIRHLVTAAALCTSRLALAQASAAPVSPAAPVPQPPSSLYDELASQAHDQMTAHELPQIPATFALGLETTEIQRPATMSELGATLINSFNDDSTIRTGVALEFAPFRMWKTNQLTAEQWVGGQVGYGLQLLDSVALSAATAENGVDSVGNKKPPLSSIGLRLDLLNTMDLRRSRDHYACVHDALLQVHSAALDRQPTIDNDPVAIDAPTASRAAAKQAMADCEARREGVAIEVAGALVATGEPAMGISTLSAERVWASFGWASGTLSATVQGDLWDHRDGTSRHDWFAGARLDKTASAPLRFDIGLEAYYADIAANGAALRQRRVGIGATTDIKFDSGLMLSVGAQGRTDFASDLALIVLTKISFVIDGKTTDLYRSYRQAL